ncbi:hypothetical protein M408DRAFT_28138 [Serendipita vermifera MAFF 305830]|uniref:Kinesin-like domain-containing protein n=1 Tax=Serendipita vermifera MAFF 305830 TaxID=933852 RepID=A0A0C3AES8_SERVB|nr:hypothetical protein M408DRAFT_28138 [Serendipita vermifera MAFF 305830]
MPLLFYYPSPHNDHGRSQHLLNPPDPSTDSWYIPPIGTLSSSGKEGETLMGFAINWEGGFTAGGEEKVSPEYSLIGNALVSLAPLSRRLSSTSTVPIFCRYTAEAIGSCRVDIKIASVTPPPKSRNGSNVSTRASLPIGTNIQPGSKVNFFLSADQVKGLGSNDFASIHLQIRLASITGASTKSQDVYPSPTVDFTSAGSSELKFKRTFQLIATPRILAYLREGYAPIEFFASLQATYLERMERWDEMREQHNIRAKPNGSAPTNWNPNLPTMRRSENDFVVEQVHDVVSWLTICELGSVGKYNPAPVLSQSPLDPGSFSLRQGLQRRLRLTLSSNSGKQLPWVAVTKKKDREHSFIGRKRPSSRIRVKRTRRNQTRKAVNVEFKPDGSATIPQWNSSTHNSSLLNRVTASGQRILLQISWSVDIDTCLDPVVFSMDMAVAI